MAYYLKIGSADRESLASLKIPAAHVSCRANGFDELSFERDVAVDASPYAYGTAIQLWDAATGGNCRFVGEVVDAQILGDTETGIVHSYTCKNLLARLETLQYTQPVSAYGENDTTTLSSFQEAKVVLGMSGTTRRTTGQQIADVLSYAVNLCGLALSIDSSVAAAGSQFPLDQRENISCWEAVVCCLRWMADYTLWVDYAGGSATVKLTQYSNLSSSTLASAGGVLKDIRATPRSDLVKPGVNIFYRKTFTTDGSSREQRFVRSAGSSSASDALNLYIDLEGSTRQTVSQAVTVSAYPDFTSLSASATKAWVLGKVPWIADLANWSIDAISRSGTHGYSKELVGGQIASWMTVGHETEFVTVDISYEIHDGSGNLLEKATTSIPIECVSTSASTKTYRRTVSYDSGESIPDGLETAVYNAWKILHWDGSLTSDIEKVGWIRPGVKINISGSASALATMGAVVQSAGVDLATGELSLAFGTCRGLEADSLVALYRATRGRRYAWSVHSVISSGDDASSVTGGHFNNAAPSPAMTRAAERISGLDSGNRTHIIDLKPSAVSFATAANASAQTIQPREVRVIVDDNGTLKAKLAQVICSEPYGTAESVGGGGTPSAPEYYATLGSFVEGSETAASDAWTAGAEDANHNPLGVKVWIVSRVVYNDAGDCILYAFVRCFTFTTSGLLQNVSAETRVTVDVPEYE